jgi:endonuclease/exonuclease/phosphatase (EEP) superfamily protein YafD
VLQEVTEQWRVQLECLVAEFPYFETIPRPSGSGMALYSRYPLESVRTLTLDASTHVGLLVDVNIANTTLTILGMHPPTPISKSKFANRNRQFSEAGSLIRTRRGPRVLIGDFNTTMWSPYFKRLLRDSGLRDARFRTGGNTGSDHRPIIIDLRI